MSGSMMMIDKREVEGSCGVVDFVEEKGCTSSCSSSIGENSDDLSHEESMDEVESPIHQLLPIRQGVSRFYNGKSKSFTSLREASTLCSIKELAKPENGSYIKKKRRNILACRLPNKKKKSISKKTHIGILAGHSTSSSNGWRSFSLADLQFVSPTLQQEAQKKPTD